MNSPLLADVGVLTVLPLTGDAQLALPSLSVCIEPSPQNGMTKPSYALVWNLQTVARKRVQATTAAVTADIVTALKRAVTELIAL